MRRAVNGRRAPLTIGVEEELALGDATDRHLVGRAGDVIGGLSRAAQPFVEHEFKTSMIETVSPVCETLEEIDGQLRSLRERVRISAAEQGCCVLATGTHPISRWEDQEATPDAGYEEVGEAYQRLADEQLLFGCHVHVGVEDPDLRIAALDRIRPWLSTLLALTANSPFWDGEDTGYASYRYTLFSRWPTFATPDRLDDWAGYEALVQGLVDSGAIDSPQRIYWTVRPSDRFPTLEFRIADACTRVSEAVMLAGLARALVETAVDEAEAGTPAPDVRSEVLSMAEWQAARYGLRDDLLDPIGGGSGSARDAVDRLLAHVAPALERSGDARRVGEAVAQVLAAGNGADRQRSALAHHGSIDGVLRTLEVQPEPGPVAGLGEPAVADTGAS